MITKFKVIEVLDGDTIKVSPKWKMTTPNGDNINGDTLKIFGYQLPNENTYGFEYAKQKLTNLLLNKIVTLKNPQILPLTIDFKTKIACNVFFNDVNVAFYFPEYRVE